MDFANPKLLYLLFAIPAFVLLYILARYSRKRKLRRFGRPEVLASLMPDASKYKPAIKLALQIIVLAALIIALARPRGGEKVTDENRKGIEVMIAFDVSRSMLASSTDDKGGVSRLNRAKFLLRRLIDKLDNDKVGLVIFAGDAYTQLPITNDFISAKMYIDELNPDMIPVQGTDIGAAIEMSLNCFSDRKDVNKAIVLITDSEDHIEGAVAMAKRAREAGVQVDVIGVGTEAGVPIPVDASRGQYFKDYNGEVVTTALNPKVAAEIAEAGGGVYVNGSAGDAVSQVEKCLDTLEKSDLGSVKYKSSAEKFPIFVWVALIFAIADMFMLMRKNRLLQKFNFFTKPQK